MKQHLFNEARYCRRCGLPAEFIVFWGKIWAECFLPWPSPAQLRLIYSGAWRSLPELRP